MKPAVYLTALLAASPVSAATTVDQAVWDRLLHAYVEDGRVDYQGFKKESAAFNAYLSPLKNAGPNSLSGQDAKLAFWINAYNAFVIKGVLDHAPIKSVQDVKGFFDKITYPVGGETLTLNEIEAKARSFKNPRVHFALVCASSSCPILRPEAYQPDRLQAQLSAQGQEFLANPQRGLRLDEAAGVAHLSQIFKWYGPDFVGGGFLTKLTGSGRILEALEPYMNESTRHKAESLRLTAAAERPSSGARTWKIEYMPYNWTLNKQ